MQTHAKLQLRLPQDIKAWLEVEAGWNDRSMNWQVVAILKDRMVATGSKEMAQARGAGAKM